MTVHRRRRPRPCNLPWAVPHSLTYAARYVVGWRCANHTPAAEAGRPEPPTGPGWPPGAWTTPTPASAGWSAIDAKHIRSGKRRSSPQQLAAAKAALKKEA